MSAATGDNSPDPLNPPEPDSSAAPVTGQEQSRDMWAPASEAALRPDFPPDAPEDIFGIPTPAPKIFPRHIPNLGHVGLFFVIALILLGIGQLLGVFILQITHIFPHRSFDALFLLSSEDARASIPIQALSYGLIALVCIPVFTVLWNEPFDEGVHWNSSKARRRFFLLALLGLAAGFSISFFGDYLPMPKIRPLRRT